VTGVREVKMLLVLSSWRYSGSIN